MIEIKDLHFKIKEKVILEDINIIIESGTYALIGPSGCGKSTILRNVIGLATPTSGTVSIDGVIINQASENKVNEVRKKCGFLFQQSALFDSLTIEENLRFPLMQHNGKLSEKEIKKMVEEKLEMVGMPGVNNMFPAELSGGMKKRAALARTIILEPKYIFYDEPTTGLDPIMSQIVGDLILELNRKLNVISIVVTHDMKLAFTVADKMGLMYNGKIMVEDSKENIKKSDNKYLKQFIVGDSKGPMNLKD